MQTKPSKSRQKRPVAHGNAVPSQAGPCQAGPSQAGASQSVASQAGEPNPKMRSRQPFDYHAFAKAFAEHGYETLTMETIAERAGLAKRTLYNHFESKERLFDTTMAVLCEEALAFLFQRYDEADLLPRPENIRAAVRAFFDYSAAYPEGRALVLSARAPTPAAARMVQEAKDKITGRIAQSFRQRRGAKGDPVTRVASILAAMTVGAADNVVREVSRTDDWDMEAVVLLVAEVWAQGISHVGLDLLARADAPVKPRARRSSGSS